jgi:hypothetical protein
LPLSIKDVKSKLKTLIKIHSAMRNLKAFFIISIIVLFSSCTKKATDPVNEGSGSIIIDHSSVKLATIPTEWVSAAKENLHIAYSHTSHGSQLTDGMSGLVEFKGESYSWNDGGTDGELDLRDYAMAGDLGNPDRTSWAASTRTYLDSHPDINVVMWAWCGEVSSASESDISTYLSLMSSLENDYPDIRFVYMTGHLDGTGLTGNLHIRNEQIRDYCRANNKILYDFADIETHNPDGVSFGEKNPDDGCNYDSDNDGTLESNWAIEWQNSHIEGTDWYTCGSAHTQPVNANMKAYAAWWLWARLAGWAGK